MLEKIASALREQCGIEMSTPIVVGVSGGPDSLCLMHVLHALGYRMVVAHMDHQLRPDSAAEAAAVEAAAGAMGLPFVMQRVDVGAHARSGKLSIEEAARELRYTFLFEQARKHQVHAVVVGHNADDQVETVLMHLIRGTGISGLRGMSYRTVLHQFDAAIPLLRPLLGTWRGEIEAYCRSNALAPHHDASNDSPEYLRNRVRHELIPILESYNPRVREALWRMAETIGLDHAMLKERVVEAWHHTVLREGSGFVSFDADGLAGQSVSLQRCLILTAADKVLPGGETSHAAVDRAVAFFKDLSSRRLDLGGGILMFREAGSIIVSRGLQALPIGEWPRMTQDKIAIPCGEPFTVSLGEGWQFTAEYSTAGASPLDLIPGGKDTLRACLDADSLPGRMELRLPHQGDRFQPLGMQGNSQKLSDFFVNAKLPARARGSWPLLCSDEVIVWVPGFRPAEPFKLRRETRRAAYFAVSRTDQIKN
jgi:tRNA(Ile)-lysidine synthase